MRKELKILSVLAFSLTGQLAFGQIKGKVQEADGEPAMGAKVEIKGTNTFTRTDDDGNFELSTGKVGDVLVITNLDEESREVTATDNLVFKFSKATITKEKEIEGVTIIGSIRVNPNEQIGSTSIVKSDAIASTPSASVNEALNGKIAGVNFAGSGGQPGAANSLVIRGVNSFTGSSNPLYIIDGVPVGRGSDDASVLLRDYASFNPLAGLDPNSIESVTVLKDAAGTALYGAQGANGVIIIKTKSGKYNQKTKFSFSTETTFQDVAFDKHHWMNSEEYIKWGGLLLAGKDYKNGVTDAYSNLSAYESTFRQSVITNRNWDGVTSTNWNDAIKRNSSNISQYSFNATGGGENTSFNIGASYYKNTPLVKFSNFDRIAANVGLNHRATEKLSFNFNGSVSHLKMNTYSGGAAFANPWMSGWTKLPIYPVYNEDGTYNTTNLGGTSYNPLEILNSNFLKSNTTTFLGAVGLDYKFIKDFKFTSNFGTQFQNMGEDMWWNPYTGDGANYNGMLQVSNSKIFDYTWTNFIQYSKKFAEKHDLTIDAGMDYQDHSYRYDLTAATNFSENSKPNLTWANNPYSVEGYKETWTQISYVGRVSYTFDRKYTVIGGFRRDGNSTFGDDKKWGNFWNAGILWNVSKENFLSSNSVLNNLQIKANYGISGNAATALWGKTQRHRATITPTTYSTEGNTALYINSAGNSDLKWEQTEQLNLGVDFGFLNNRITGSFDYYDKRTKDLISLVTIPYTTGGPNSYYANVGRIRNRGIEMSLTGIPVKTDNFYWSITAMASMNKSKVLAIAEGANLEAYGKRLDIGRQVGEYYMYGWAGVNPDTGEGMWYTDETKTATTTNISEAKRFYQGKTSLPIWQATLSNEISYKKFKLSFMFSGSFDYSVYDQFNSYYMSDGATTSYNQDTALLYDSWTPDNPNATNPIQWSGNTSNSRNLSTRHLRKGDHIRLKEVKFSYTFGKDFLGDIGIDEVVIYVRGTNLITWAFDKKLRFDPEAYSTAAKSDGYPDFYGRGYYDFTAPIMRTYSFGINVNF